MISLSKPVVRKNMNSRAVEQALFDTFEANPTISDPQELVDLALQSIGMASDPDVNYEYLIQKAQQMIEDGIGFEKWRRG